jgi:hypothetical protein
VTQERSAVPVSRPRKHEVELAWAKYAYAFEDLARLINSSPPSLVVAYAEIERARMQTIEEKHTACKALLMEYFEAYDNDQREAFGHGA